jgi:hypothetical protein
MRHLYSFSDFLNEGKVEDIHAKFYTGMEVSTFHQIVTADPTSIVQNGETKKMGTYSKWLLKLFQDGKLLLEDLYKATEYLIMFDKLKAQKVIAGTAADINRYDSLPDLFKQIKTIGGTGEASEDESCLLNDRYFINSGEAVVFHEDERYLIVIPRTLKASQFYAHGTEWCTKYPDMFKQYSEQGDLYVIINKHKLNSNYELRRMQFHFQSNQYMDIDDDVVSLNIKDNFIYIFRQVRDSWRMRYDEVLSFREGRAKVGLYDEYGFVDLDGNVVVPLMYDFVGHFSEGRAKVKLNGEWGFIDLDGNEVVPLKYVWASDYQEGRTKVKLDGKWGFIDLNGNVVVSLKYDWVHDYQEGRAKVKLDGKWGFIDLNGNVVVSLKYDTVEFYHEGRARVELNGKYGAIDLDGNETWD